MRQILTSIRLALSALLRSKIRSALTSLGILIGIAAVVVVTALGTGARKIVSDQIESLGSNLLFVFYKPVTKSGARGRLGTGGGLSDRDAETIRREASAIDDVTVYSDVNAQVVSEYGNGKITVVGADGSYFRVRSFEIDRGRAFTDSEEQTKAKVVVIGPTAIVELGGAHMDAGGLDLLGVVCGSEGQLGVVTEATLRILPKPEGARPVLIAFGSNEVAGACVADIIKAGVLPVAIEFMDRPCIRACEDFAHAGYPDCEALLIVEVEGSPAEIDEQLGLIRQIAMRHDPLEFRESGSEAESAKIWLGRKSAFGAMGQINDYMCLDGTIPVSALPEVLRRIGEMSREFGLDVANVFHAGDGNMHPLILYDANKPGDLEKCEALGAAILTLCVEVGGCLTGEHGVGIEKRDLMSVQFAPVDMEAQMRVKDAFDPKWLLNPAKVFPLSASESRRAG